MAVSKVVYKESANATPVTWMDATSATAGAEDITSPKTAMLANGVVTTGTGTGTGSAEPQWELINEVTTTQNETQVLINTDSYGNSFSLTELICIVSAPQTTTGTRDTIYGLYGYVNPINNWDQQDSLPSLYYTSASANLFTKITIKTRNGAPLSAEVINASSNSNTQTISAMAKNVITNKLTWIKFYQASSSQTLIPSGTNIKLYGVRMSE